MREIDYSVPDSEKDVTPQFKVGDYVEGDCLYLERGQIESIEMSTGARKGLIYKIGLSYFFYNFIKPWYDGMVMEKIGVNTLYPVDKPVKFKHERGTFTITDLYVSKVDSHITCYVIATPGADANPLCCSPINESGLKGIGFYELRPKQVERIYHQIFG